MTVRALGPQDWETTKQIRLRALLDAPEAFGGTYEGAVQRDDASWQEWPSNGQVFAAIDGQQAVGMACGWRDPENPEVTTLIGMWVAPEARGGDTAGALIDAVVGWARAQNTTAVELNVYDINPRAHRAYVKAGFHDLVRTHMGKPGVTMRRDLSTLENS